MRKFTLVLAASLLALITLAACGGDSPTATPNTVPQPGLTPTTGNEITGLAPVDSIDVRILESKPVQVQVVIKGNLPNPCTTITNVEQTRDGNTFNIKISTSYPGDKACIDVISPYEQTVNISVAGLPAGTYTVTSNEVSTTFVLTPEDVTP